jgi:hypothetical protein
LFLAIASSERIFSGRLALSSCAGVLCGALLFLTFFGYGKLNYGYTLRGNFLVKQGKAIGNKENATPFLTQAQGKRFVWASEAPFDFGQSWGSLGSPKRSLGP